MRFFQLIFHRGANTSKFVEYFRYQVPELAFQAKRMQLQNHAVGSYRFEFQQSIQQCFRRSVHAGSFLHFERRASFNRAQLNRAL
jgi:hypothetical protein